MGSTATAFKVMHQPLLQAGSKNTPMKIHLNKRREGLDIAMEEKEVESDHNQHRENIITPFSLVTLFVPIVALVLVLAYGNLLALNYLHVLTGGTWTGIDLFMGIVMGRILKGLGLQAGAKESKICRPILLLLDK